MGMGKVQAKTMKIGDTVKVHSGEIGIVKRELDKDLVIMIFEPKISKVYGYFYECLCHSRIVLTERLRLK